VTKIPSEHTAAKSLENAFRVLGEERARSRPGRRRPVAPARVVLATLTSVLVVGGVATATKVFTGDGDAVRSDDRGLTGVEGRVKPALGYRQLAQARAPDPTEPQPWGLRLSKSANGFTCVTLGRVVGNRLGVLQDGQFNELPARSGGMCASLDGDHVVMAVRDYSAASPGRRRSVVYGAVDRTVRAIHVLSVQGATTPVPIAPDGSFLVVRGGQQPFHRARLVVDGSAGRRVRPLGP
jgi:hypothetical protein